jgi:hypothetical protein
MTTRTEATLTATAKWQQQRQWRKPTAARLTPAATGGAVDLGGALALGRDPSLRSLPFSGQQDDDLKASDLR